MGYLFVVTGRRGSGKTSSCLYLLDQAVSEGIDVGGVVETRSTCGDSQGYDLVDCTTGRKMRLACPYRPSRAWFRPPGRGFWFSKDAFEVGNSILTRLHRSPSSLVLIDELGTLEVQGGGLYRGVRAIMRVLDVAPVVVVLSSRPNAAQWVYEDLGRDIPREIWIPGLPSDLWTRIRSRLLEMAASI